MDSLVGYGSDDEVELDRYGQYHSSVDGGGSGAPRRKDDDTNYDDVNMDLSELHRLSQDSQAESEPELPPAEPHATHHRHDDKPSRESREREDRRRNDRDRDRRDHKRDDRYRSERSERNERSERSERRDSGSGRRGLLGDRPCDNTHDTNKSQVPALMDLKPFGGEPPPTADRKSHDARDAVSPRFTEGDRSDRDRGDRDRERERERERERDRDREHRHSRRSEERKPSHRYGDRGERSRSRGAAPQPSHASHASSSSSSSERSGEYRPSSYRVNKKLQVMEKMGLQIKTPDGQMATAQQLRAARSDSDAGLYPLAGAAATRILDQVQKRKLLWSSKSKSDTNEAAKWSGTRFAQDNDGKQVSKFMRLMGIKEPAAVKPEPVDNNADPIKKQEELFQAMQAQYEVARATTHTMRGVGLGFQRQY